MTSNENAVLSNLSIGAAALGLYLSSYNLLSLAVLLLLLYRLMNIYLLQSEKIAAGSDFQVIIVGSGFSGICMGKRLNDAGVKYIILEKDSQLGGTWHQNNYPGVACDVPSPLYSFSFFLNPWWTRSYSGGQEILQYLRDTAGKFLVYPHIQFNKQVLEAVWDKDHCLWRVTTQDDCVYEANILVSATGTLNVPTYPNIPGREVFNGESFHTALWKKSFDPTNKRIGIIGTGASAVQAVPTLAGMDIASLTVFQRTPVWCTRRLMDVEYPQWLKKLFSLVPILLLLQRWTYFWILDLIFFQLVFPPPTWYTRKPQALFREWLKKLYLRVVKDPATAEKLIPKYAMGCKRVTVSDTYLKAYNKENVHLVADGVEAINQTGIKTGDGRQHDLDAIIYATGFDVLKSVVAFKQIGVGGEDVSQLHGDAPSAVYGICNPAAPNFFWLYGPNTNLAHSSVIFMIECQVNYSLKLLKEMVESGARGVVVKKSVQQQYTNWIKQKMKGMAFGDNPSVSGWYRNSRGINWTLWPLDHVTYWRKTRNCQINEYNLIY